MSSLPNILITNDDGIHAPGLAELVSALEGLGKLWVVAPDAERSAAGHAITMLNVLRVAETFQGEKFFGQAVSGTPADCVKLAICNLLPSPPDLVVSGINPGPNTGTNVLYSGTVSAAMEGIVYGIPSLAVSMGSLRGHQDFRPGGAYARRVAAMILQHGLAPGVMLNLNVPSLPMEQIKGIRVTSQSRFQYHDRYERRQDPRGRDYYWISLENAEVIDPAAEGDEVVLAQGYASLTPLQHDLTSRNYMETLRSHLADPSVTT